MSTEETKPPGDQDTFPVSKDDRLFLALDEDNHATADGHKKAWKVLIVDDDDEVHVVTKLALDDFAFTGGKLEFLNAHSGAEARRLLEDNPDIALILLDVVMETEYAGLEFARYVRQDMDNHFVRIILRTGQPGLAPERHVMEVYDINDYRAKTELTRDRLFSVVYTALSAYRDLVALARSRHRLTGLVNDLEQFALIASRDMSVPLKDLTKQVQLLQRRYKDRIDKHGQECLDSIWNTLMRLQAVVDDLLTLANIGGQSDTREIINCELVLDEACDNLRSLIRKRGVMIMRNPLPSIYANRWQMVQLFQNLLSNAINFQPGDRPEVRISAESKGNEWLFTFADKGLGIKPENKEKIFTVFQRFVEGADYDGTGIGLTICEKIVRWHGGKIWVDSVPLKGSVFHFTIPLGE